MTTVRKAKWLPPPHPSPIILHLSRRTSSRKQLTKSGPGKSYSGGNQSLRHPSKGKLESLFDEEMALSYRIPPVVLLNSGKEGENGEEKWRLEAEMLRGECNLLRMERQLAEKKLERERSLLEKSLKSAVHTLLSGKEKVREGKNANLVFEEIEEMTKKLEELQRSSRVKDPVLQNCSNVDEQASLLLLQKQLEKIGGKTDENCAKNIQIVSGTSFSTELARDGRIRGCASRGRSNRLFDVEALRRKMEGLSKGKLLKRMEEEYKSMSATASCSLPNSDLSSFSVQPSSQEAKSGELKICSGRCKTIVQQIMEQVRAEMEQWSQMQEMLGQVRGEMEELQACRDFWEERALQFDHKTINLKSQVDEWKQKALALESKESQLQKQVQELQQKLEKSNMEKTCVAEVKASKHLAPISLGAQLLKEKRLLAYRVHGSKVRSENKDNNIADHSDGERTVHKHVTKLVSLNRHPFKDIGNLSPLMRLNSRRYVYPLHSTQDS